MEQALELLKMIIIWSGIFSTPFLAAMALIYIYDWLNKKMNRVPRVPKRQIVGMTAEEGDKEFGITPEVEDSIDYKQLTLVELKAIAKKKKIPRYSRLHKDELISLLEAQSPARSPE